MSSVPNDCGSQVPALLMQLWARFQPLAVERVAALERYGAMRIAGLDDEAELARAHIAAHDLVGSLGTYGWHRGSTLALAYDTALYDGSPGELLLDLCVELRSVVNP